jgi:hypothetical protein
MFTHSSTLRWAGSGGIYSYSSQICLLGQSCPRVGPGDPTAILGGATQGTSNDCAPTIVCRLPVPLVIAHSQQSNRESTWSDRELFFQHAPTSGLQPSPNQRVCRCDPASWRSNRRWGRSNCEAGQRLRPSPIFTLSSLLIVRAHLSSRLGLLT